MSLSFRYRAVAVLLAVVPLSGCLFRSHKVEQPLGAVELKTATQQELIDYINTQAAKIQSMQATVDIDTTVGGVKKGKVTDYQEIRGYVLARKPAMLRMIGLMPIVRTQAFDMVSDGREFKLWIPPKNRFVVGRNDVETHSTTQPMENVRPQHIYDALLLRSIDAQNEIAVLENETELVADPKGHKVQRADYVIDVIAKDDHGWFLSRKIVFSRTDLLPHRQLIYDDGGNVVTNALYENYKDGQRNKFSLADRDCAAAGGVRHHPGPGEAGAESPACRRPVHPGAAGGRRRRAPGPAVGEFDGAASQWPIESAISS